FELLDAVRARVFSKRNYLGVQLALNFLGQSGEISCSAGFENHRVGHKGSADWNIARGRSRMPLIRSCALREVRKLPPRKIRKLCICKSLQILDCDHVFYSPSLF